MSLSESWSGIVSCAPTRRWSFASMSLPGSRHVETPSIRTVPFTFHQAPPALALRRLAAFPTGLGSQIPVRGETPRLRRDGTAAFASRVDGKRPILCEATFFMRDVSAAFPGNLDSYRRSHAVRRQYALGSLESSLRS